MILRQNTSGEVVNGVRENLSEMSWPSWLTKWERRPRYPTVEEMVTPRPVFCSRTVGERWGHRLSGYLPWTNPDEVAALAEAESAQVTFDTSEAGDGNRAIFHLAESPTRIR